MIDLERIVSAVGNAARPYVLISAATSSALATVSIVWMRGDLMAGAAFVGAAWGGVAMLYGAKALEERGKAKSEADVAIAQTGTAGGLALTDGPPAPSRVAG